VNPRPNSRNRQLVIAFYVLSQPLTKREFASPRQPTLANHARRPRLGTLHLLLVKEGGDDTHFILQPQRREGAAFPAQRLAGTGDCSSRLGQRPVDGEDAQGNGVQPRETASHSVPVDTSVSLSSGRSARSGGAVEGVGDCSATREVVADVKYSGRAVPGRGFDGGGDNGLDARSRGKAIRLVVEASAVYGGVGHPRLLFMGTKFTRTPVELLLRPSPSHRRRQLATPAVILQVPGVRATSADVDWICKTRFFFLLICSMSRAGYLGHIPARARGAGFFTNKVNPRLPGPHNCSGPFGSASDCFPRGVRAAASCGDIWRSRSG
jgi:hypothetical protein